MVEPRLVMRDSTQARPEAAAAAQAKPAGRAKRTA